MPKRSVQVIPGKISHAVKISLPGSKSISLRDLVLASLAQGVSHIRDLGECDDTTRMIESLRLFGIEINQQGSDVEVRGIGIDFPSEPVEIHTGLSGTSTRFLIALALLKQGTTRIDGLPPLRIRPNSYLLAALQTLGAKVEKLGDEDLPILITGTSEPGSKVRINGDVSSQYFSALLQIAPLLKDGLLLEVDGILVSEPYVNITIAEMNKFGVNVQKLPDQAFFVPPQKYFPRTLTVEGDASASSYFAALATIHGATVEFTNIGSGSKQGDYAFFDICTRLGATVTRTQSSTLIVGPPNGQMNRLDSKIDMSSMPDVAPTLIAIAPLIPGGVEIVGLATLRVKECDRLAVPASHLTKLGVTVIEGPDYIKVKPAPLGFQPNPVNIETYDDHRIAMSFAILATMWRGIRILDADCVNKTYPKYWDQLITCGFDLINHDD